MLVPQVVGVRLDGRLPGGRDRDRPRAHDHRAAAQDRRRRQVRRVLRARPRRPRAGRPRDHREHVPRVRRDVRLLPRRRADPAYLRLTGRSEERIAARRGVLQGEPALARRDRRARVLAGCRARPRPRSSRASRARAARRTAWRSREAKDSFLDSLASFGHGYGNGTIDKGVADTFPASDPPLIPGTGVARDRPRARAGRDGRRARPCAPRSAQLDGDGDRAARRLGRDRRHHELHEHVEPAGDARRGPRREEGGRARPRAQAVGQVLARAGLARRHRLLRSGGPDAVPRGAGLPHGRLRLHDLHRELRPAPRADLGGGRGGRPRRLLGAERQPQLRGAHPPPGEGELPRLAAAGRRLRARGPDGHRPRRPSRSARAGDGNDVFLRDLWPTHRGDRGVDRGGARRRDVPQAVRRRLHRRRALAGAARPRGRPLRLERRAPRTSRRPPFFAGHAARARAARRTSRAPAASSRSATASPPTTSRRPGRSSPRARPGSTCSSTASSGASSTPTARGAATTRSWCAARSRTSACATCSSRVRKARGRRTSRTARR